MADFTPKTVGQFIDDGHDTVTFFNGITSIIEALSFGSEYLADKGEYEKETMAKALQVASFYLTCGKDALMEERERCI